ncbi:MAG: PEP-CTERM sorting domain-containing protein [Verrucomicrobiales bacterium]
MKNPQAFSVPFHSLLLMSLMASAAPLSAATIVYYDIPTTGTTNAVTENDPYVSATSITKGAGDFTVSTSSGTAFLQYSASAADLSGAISGNDYLEFSITVPSTSILDLDSIALTHRAEGSGGSNPVITSNLSVFISTDGFATAPLAGNEIGTATTTSASTTTNTLLITDPIYQAVSDATLTFRIYGYDDSNRSGVYNRLDNIRVNGTAVPEPSSLLSVLAGLSVPLLRRRRF